MTQTEPLHVDHPSKARAGGGAKAKRDGGLLRIRVRLTGRTPLLMNAMSEDELLRLWTKEKAAKTAERPTPEEAARGKIYRTPDGHPEVPTKNLFAAMVSAGRYVRMDGKKQVSTAKSTVLPSLLSIEDPQIPLYKPGTDTAATWEVDLQQGRNPNGGEAVCVVRPRFDQWEIRFVIEVNLAECKEAHAREIVGKACSNIGLMDFRPERKGTFGRSDITLWERIED